MAPIKYRDLQGIVQKQYEVRHGEVSIVMKVATALAKAISRELEAPTGVCRVGPDETVSRLETLEAIEDGLVMFDIELAFSAPGDKEKLYTTVPTVASTQEGRVCFRFTGADQEIYVTYAPKISAKDLQAAADLAISLFIEEVSNFRAV